MSTINKILSTLFFEYDTPKIVNIKSRRIGCTNRLIQLLILAYIIGYAIVWQKGYQLKSEVSSAVTTKVKGVFRTYGHVDPLYNRVWDPTDYVFPPYGDGDLFVATNVIITKNQKMGECPESPSVKDAHCLLDSDCEEGSSSQVGNGVFTGKCVNSTSPQTKTCQVRAWCPVENDNPPSNSRPILLASANSTVLIKNVIEFPFFGNYKRRNILESSNSTYLQTCVYNQETDPFCPVFRLNDIVESAGENYSRVAARGGVFQIEIQWNCNLDWDFMRWCVPVYLFERMDNENAKISPGWNFRSAEYHEEARRTLFKFFGIKFLVKVTGVAGKFNLVPLLINLGSGLALLGLATILCDLLVLNCVKYKKFYKENKYLVITGPDAFQGLIEDDNSITSPNNN